MHDDVALIPSQNQGATYRSFNEAARWQVWVGDELIGDVWRAERSDGVKCWMQSPHVLGFDFAGSAVISGYSRTTKKGAVQDVLDWHFNRKRSFSHNGWTVHCRSHRHGTVHQGESYDFLALHADLGSRWISAEHNDVAKPHRGAMGGLGWQVTSKRGARTVIVHEEPGFDVAIRRMIDIVGREPDVEEARASVYSHLEIERHYPYAPQMVLRP